MNVNEEGSEELEKNVRVALEASRMRPVSAKQAGALLTANSKYFSHMLQKGVSGKFGFARPFYGQLVSHAQLLANLLHQNSQTIPFVLNFLCAGFTSDHPDSCLWTCRLFTRVAAQLTNLGDQATVQAWLCSPASPNAYAGHTTSACWPWETMAHTRC